MCRSVCSSFQTNKFSIPHFMLDARKNIFFKMIKFPSWKNDIGDGRNFRT